MRRISATDAVFLDLETPNGPMIIGGLFILDPSTAPNSFVRHRDILEYVESRLHLAPNLRRKLVYHPLGLDEPRLIDDPDFDLEFHVRHVALPKPRDWRQLKIMAARLVSRPMDLHRPLWEMYIIEGLEELEGIPADAFAMLFMMHHATFDGKAGGAALWAFMQDTPEYQPVPPDNRWVADRKPDFFGWTVSSIQEGIGQLIANVAAMPRLGHNIVSGMAAGEARSIGDLDDLTAPATRFQHKITSHRVWDYVRFRMEDVQAIRNALGKPKMNDLLVTLIGGAMRRYLSRHGELPDKSLLALCPISVRGGGDPAAGGNFVSGMRVALGTNVQDPIARLSVVADSSRKGKAQAEAVGGDFFGSLMAMTPYPVRSRLTRGAVGLVSRMDRFTSTINTTISNVPNPPGGHYFTGAKVVNYAGFGPLVEGSGLFHTITGMDFEVTISITSCRELMPDIAFYCSCLVDSFDELRIASARPKETENSGVQINASAPRARRRRSVPENLN
ncbi:wax ester/triacylglycerol synthase family O-acyltransferase [Sphingomonas sp.]|uniref:wax ester/triacylglycerol synthase family O-acyltransferase n=1 Tax=Sphingomonas sp. TaxID=28214 RepID=UPI003CC5141A